jgi:hypothetical protein
MPFCKFVYGPQNGLPGPNALENAGKSHAKKAFRAGNAALPGWRFGLKYLHNI